jgi:hypothetical protein
MKRPSQRTRHKIKKWFWLAVTPVTLKYPESVLWVAFMSQYANYASEAAAEAAEAAKESSEQ